MPSVGKEAEQLEFSKAATGNVKWYNFFGKHFSCFLKS